MSTTTPRPAAPPVSDPRPPDGRAAWARVLAWSAAVVALVDVIFFLLIGEVIPPLAVGAALTAVGIAVLRRRRAWGIGILGVVSLVMLIGTIPFAVSHLGHPQSGIDWTHAVMGVFGRVVALGAMAAAWRGVSERGARRAGAGAIAALCGVLVVAAVATFGTSGDELQPGDVAGPIEDASFPELIEVAAGGVVFVDNGDAFRHTFTIEGTTIDAEIPALKGVRVPIDIAPGEYALICAVPGHEFMSGTVLVR